MRPTLLITIGLLMITATASAVPAAVYAQQLTQNTTSTAPATTSTANFTMPSDQEVETEIAQASPNREYDRLVNQGLNNCMEWLRMGNNPYEVACDAPAMTEEKNLDCEIYENQLLVCNPNSTLGQKFQIYVNMTTTQ